MRIGTKQPEVPGLPTKTLFPVPPGTKPSIHLSSPQRLSISLLAKPRASTMILTRHSYRFCLRARLMRLSEAFLAIALIWGSFMLLLAAIRAPAGVFAALSAIAAGVIGISYARCSCMRYELLDDALIVRCGIFFTMRDVVPYKKIEHVALAKNRAGDMFDVCELRIRPARSAIIDTAGVGPEEQADELSCLQHGYEYVLLLTHAQARETADFIHRRIEQIREQDAQREARR